MKEYIRRLLFRLHLDITRNMRYDRQTLRVIRKTMRPASNAIDVGAHKGEILKEFIKASPKGGHYAFEPIPHLYEKLREQFGTTCHIYPFALGASSGHASFKYVRNAPAYSGLKERDYEVAQPVIEQLQVEVRTLDEVIPEDTWIDLIKIDVEGGEFDVLRGAQNLLRRCKPLLIFEFGKGAAEYYGAGPEDLFQYLTQSGYFIYTLTGWLNESEAMNLEEMSNAYFLGGEYYFIGDCTN